MPYHAARPRDALRTIRHLTKPPFLRAVARAAADWDFLESAPVPSIALDSLVSTSTPVRLRVQPPTYGDTPLLDLLVLSLLVAHSHPKILFEFGTFNGVGALHMALNAPEGTVHTLELSPGQHSSLQGLEWESTIDAGTIASVFKTDQTTAHRIVQHWGDSRQFDTSPLRGRVDFIFIDAAHSYEFVRSDTAKALEMAAPGALIVWHDYHRICPDVQRVVAEQALRFSPKTVHGTGVAFMVVD